MPVDASALRRPAVFWDRDGVINESPGEGYLLSWSGFVFNPGILEALRLCVKRGYALVLVTSQQGVGKGLMSLADLDEIHAQMQGVLRAGGAVFDGIEHCTHLSGSCSCRKPSPEMILRAAERLHLDVDRSWMIGDHDRDILMGQRAGVLRTVRVLSHHAPEVVASYTVRVTAELLPLLQQELPAV
jgi:D-glycero-D-manno-heptose 1,7-bisphosphate phosphatase